MMQERLGSQSFVAPPSSLVFLDLSVMFFERDCRNENLKILMSDCKSADVGLDRRRPGEKWMDFAPFATT